VVETPLEVWLGLKEPQAPALPHVTDQFTMADEPLLTVAMSDDVALTFKDADGVVAKVIETIGGGGDWPPPPHPVISPVPISRKKAAQIRMILFRSVPSASLDLRGL
jgi:hypothetical protein